MFIIMIMRAVIAIKSNRVHSGHGHESAPSLDCRLNSLVNREQIENDAMTPILSHLLSLSLQAKHNDDIAFGVKHNNKNASGKRTSQARMGNDNHINNNNDSSVCAQCIVFC